jgi:hypothetical protein
MFNKKILAASMAAAISTGMVAQSHAMQMQENNLGQVLLSPLYITAGDGLNSEITVVNVRTDAAVKAKVVFRDGAKSREVLDFILYLTPGDVWRGKVTGPTDAAVLESADDSILHNNGDFASEDNPVVQPFFDAQGTVANNGLGHFEVIGAYSIRNGVTNVRSESDDGLIVVEQGMAKPDLKQLFDRIEEEGKDSISDSDSPFPAYASSVDPRHLQLFGEVELTDGGTNSFANFLIPALGPNFYGPNAIIGENIIDYYVIQNPFYDVFVTLESNIGQKWGPRGSDLIGDVEVALAAMELAFEYDVENSNITLPIVSFVTKYRHFNDRAGVGFCTLDDAGASREGYYSAPFNDSLAGGIIFSFNSFDNSENNEVTIDGQFSGDAATFEFLLDEVNILPQNYFSTSGWANFNMVDVREGCLYDGAPVLGVTLKNGGSGWMLTETSDFRGKTLFDLIPGAVPVSK